jgi:hypothetical protein
MTVIGALSSFRELRKMSPHKRASVDWCGHLPGGRQTGSYSEMGSEKFGNSAKSGYNKGTIRSDIWYLVVSKDVRRHRLILSRQRSRVRVSSSPPFLIKHLRLWNNFRVGTKRYKFRARRRKIFL